MTKCIELLPREVQLRAAIGFLAVLLMASSALAQVTSTLCQVADVVTPDTTDLRLVGCGEGFKDDVLWHLDRADSFDGRLDGKTHRLATGKGAVVYVCDTGIRRDHDEFLRADGSNVIAGISPRTPTQVQPVCPNGDDPAVAPCFTAADLQVTTHGTATASIVAGIHTGVAPDAKIVSVLMYASGVDFWLEAFNRIIRHAWDPSTPQFRTAIVNMSFAPGIDGSDRRFPEIEAKMREMIGGVDRDGHSDPAGKRFLFVTIGGNVPPPGASSRTSQCDANGNSQLFPAVLGPSIDGLITVGGIDETNAVWSGACKGAAIEVLAPADRLLVASITARDHYRHAPWNSGTSYASPYVAGLAACLLERNPDLTPVELEARLEASGSRVTTLEEPTAGGRVAIFDFISQLPRRRSAKH